MNFVGIEVCPEDLGSEVSAALSEGRRVIILSEWREHCRLLAEKIRDMGKEPIILDGSLKKKSRDEMFELIRNMPRKKDLLVIATRPYIGEGFDCPQLDTLLMAFPIAFRGKVVQYVGRLISTGSNSPKLASVYSGLQLDAPQQATGHLKTVSVVLAPYVTFYNSSHYLGFSHIVLSTLRCHEDRLYLVVPEKGAKVLIFIDKLRVLWYNNRNKNSPYVLKGGY